MRSGKVGEKWKGSEEGWGGLEGRARVSEGSVRRKWGEVGKE